jgi:hypothetical protein
VSEARIAVPFVASSPDPEVPAKAQRRKFGAEARLPSGELPGRTEKKVAVNPRVGRFVRVPGRF